jgi:ATP-dependent helicase/nuclease subunit B
MAAWFVEHETGRRADIVAIETETKLTADIGAEDETGSAPITLSAQMDRLDQRTDGWFTIIDYKSGSLPAASRIAEGWPPQLPLEAAIVARSRNAEVASIEAWGVGGSGEGGEAKDLTVSRGKQVISAAEAGEAAWEGLARLLIQFSDPAMPYLAEPRAAEAPRYSDYRHLARIDREGGNDE